MSNIHTRLTSSQNHDLAVMRKLFSLLELRRVLDDLDLVNTVNIRNVRCDMETSADSDSIACPGHVNVIRTTVVNNMTTSLTSSDRSHRS